MQGVGVDANALSAVGLSARRRPTDGAQYFVYIKWFFV